MITCSKQGSLSDRMQRGRKAAGTCSDDKSSETTVDNKANGIEKMGPTEKQDEANTYSW
jgi:hypothetical protein